MAARDWYSERRDGLGDAFIDDVDEAISDDAGLLSRLDAEAPGVEPGTNPFSHNAISPSRLMLCPGRK